MTCWIISKLHTPKLIHCEEINICNVDIFNVCLNDNLIYNDWFSKLYAVDNIKMLGQVIFTNYYFYFILAGFVLLVGMISSILLSKDSNKNIRRYQLVFQQLSRDVSHSVFLMY